MYQQIDLNEIITIIIAGLLMSIFVEYPFINLKKLIFDDKSVNQKQLPASKRSPVSLDVNISSAEKNK